MTRWFIIVLLLVAAPTLAHAQPKKKPPNIIYIMTDDHAGARHQRVRVACQQDPTSRSLGQRGRTFDEDPCQELDLHTPSGDRLRDARFGVSEAFINGTQPAAASAPQ